MKRLIKKIKSTVNAKYQAERVLQEMRQLQYCIRRDQLTEKAINSKDSGVSSEKLCEEEVIVSLTTYGKRLYEVAFTIESIMQGSMKPNKIVLWLGEDLKDTRLPLALQNQQKRGLEIAFCKDVRSYKKLIPALCKYPQAGIITIDDDLVYDYDLVEKLVNAHMRYPQDIIANRMHRIVLGRDGKPVSYIDWEWNANPDIEETSHLLFLTGGGGTFYPPNSLHPEVKNEKVFMDICKFADDVWFNAMALMNGTKVRKCYTHSPMGEDYLYSLYGQEKALCHINVGQNCANDRQILSVFNKYQLWGKLTDK